jgi:hypothetical protein
MYIKLILHFRFNLHLNLLGMYIKLILHFRFNWHLNLLGMYIKLILHFRFNWDLKLIEGCATQCVGGRISYEKLSFMVSGHYYIMKNKQYSITVLITGSHIFILFLPRVVTTARGKIFGIKCQPVVKTI